MDVTAFGYGAVGWQPSIFEAEPYLVAEMKKNFGKDHQNARVGLIATGDSFVAGQNKIDRSKISQMVLAVEMEGAAIISPLDRTCTWFAMSDTAKSDANVAR